MTRPQGLLFDWDNTLVESWPTIHEALVVTFTALGREPWTFDETRRRVRRSLRDVFPDLFGSRWEEARKLYLDTFTAIHLEQLKARPGVETMLETLVLGGFFLGVVSNKTGAVLRREAEHLGWTQRFRRLVGAGDAPVDKPAAAPIQLALAGSGILPGEAVWYVGDTALDMECAANAGCRAVLLGERDPEDAGFAHWPPSLHFSDTAALLAHLRQL
jgi:phosphoglycolate phosphatase